MSAESAAMERINESLQNIGMELKLARQERQDKRTREANIAGAKALSRSLSVNNELKLAQEWDGRTGVSKDDDDGYFTPTPHYPNGEE